MRNSGQGIWLFVHGDLRNHRVLAIRFHLVMLMMAVQQFNVVSYNLHGLNQGRPMLLDLLGSFSIICVQEHWLCSRDFNLLCNLNSDYTVYASYAVDSVLATAPLKGRPFGGLAIFINKLWSATCKLICAEDRFIAMMCGRLLIINVYFPCFSSVSDDFEFEDLLASIANLLCSNTYEHCLICGDFNFQFVKSHSRWTIFSQFLGSHQLVPTDDLLTGSRVTYGIPGHSRSSFIDHFVVSQNLLTSVTSVNILDSGINLSDHSPIALSLQVGSGKLFAKSVAKSSTFPKHNVKINALDWSRGNLGT